MDRLGSRNDPRSNRLVFSPKNYIMVLTKYMICLVSTQCSLQDSSQTYRLMAQMCIKKAGSFLTLPR